MTKQVTIDGVSVELTDTTAQIVQRALAKYNDDFEEFKKKLSEKEKEKEEEKKKSSDAAVLIVTKDTQIKELQDKLKASELTPEMMDAHLLDRANVIQKAKMILGDGLVIKDQTIQGIRRQVVDARLGDISKGYSDEHVKVSFDTLSADVKATAGQGTSGLQQAFSAPRMPTMDAAGQAYDEYCRDLSNAWQKKSTVGQVN